MHSQESDEVSHISSFDDESGDRELRRLYTVVDEMVRNSTAQAEGMKKILSELLGFPQAGKESEPQLQTRPHRPRERQRRAELDLRLKVRSIHPLLDNIPNATFGRPTCVNTLS